MAQLQACRSFLLFPYPYPLQTVNFADGRELRTIYSILVIFFSLLLLLHFNDITQRIFDSITSLSVSWCTSTYWFHHFTTLSKQFFSYQHIRGKTKDFQRFQIITTWKRYFHVAFIIFMYLLLFFDVAHD